MILQAFYMESLDEIDIENLPKGEVQSRRIAKNFSVFPTFIVYATFLPLLMILYYCYQPGAEKLQSIIFGLILKPIRWTFYQIVYLFCNFLRKTF
ncbi:hypothetical protein [Calothrix sp. PCC 7507]|uniref:hypothetical protein n=1 Tax=Calothrix sp. PCC 7507 TaxID=99598 RepID=UPI00029F0ACE|nr:hypothetical protein [Calothrix sp. PCC 7507]AFY35900.1 hypothetical protein Cal7507_5573 [Calothrix sp. PCC 7507]